MLLIVLLVFGISAKSSELKPLPDLQPPSNVDKKHVSQIETIALQWWLKNRGLLAEESLRVAGYFSVARPIAKFAARDDRVWEIRVIYMHTGGPSGILWINDRTSKVIGLGVEDKDHNTAQGKEKL